MTVVLSILVLKLASNSSTAEDVATRLRALASYSARFAKEGPFGIGRLRFAKEEEHFCSGTMSVFTHVR